MIEDENRPILSLVETDQPDGETDPELEGLITAMELKAHALARQGGKQDDINALFLAIAALEKER